MGHNEFEGAKVRVRAVEPEDWEVWHSDGYDTDLARRGGATHLPLSKAAHRQQTEEATKASGGDTASLVIESLDGVVVGGLSVHQSDRRNRVFHFGIGIRREHWRKGYATEALELVFRFYFRELGYQKVESGVYAFNEPSLRFHEAFGFVVEGRRRRALFTNGEYHDIFHIGMTDDEFRERHP